MKITNLNFAPVVLHVGDILTVTATVVNDGKTPVESITPPGNNYQYRQTVNFRDLGFTQAAGHYTVFATFFPGAAEFAFRWGFPTLAPGATATVTGKILMQIPGGWMFSGGIMAPTIPPVEHFNPTLIRVLDTAPSGDLTARVVALEQFRANVNKA